MPADWRERGQLTAGGKTLDYACWGPPPDKAPTLVLLHEGLGSAGLWRDFPQRLNAATGLGVFAWSRAGYGFSDPADLPRPVDYMTREAVDVVPQVLDAIGIARGLLIGHSDGATIAAIHGGMVRDPRIAGLVLMAPHFLTEAMGLAEIARAGEAFRTSDLPQRMGKYHRDPDHTFSGWNGAWLNPEFRDWNVEHVLVRINVPVLAIQGREDQYGTLRQIDVIGEKCPAPVERLVLDNCRHAPFLDRAETVVEAVARFSRAVGLPV